MFANVKSRRLIVQCGSAAVFDASQVFSVSGAKGQVIYKRASGDNGLTVSRGGKVVVAKGLKTGVHRLKTVITAMGTANYKQGSKKVTVEVIVK